METETRSVKIPDDLAGKRLDQALACLFDEFSRARLQQWLKQGQILVDGRQCKPKDTVLGGETVTMQVELEPEPDCQPEDIPLTIVYEDNDIIVIDKPAGLVVHPAAGNWSGTLQNALLYHDPALAAVPRAGIVHRLDKETSGLLVVARTLQSHKYLVEQLQQRAIEREYLAIINGVMPSGGTVDEPIGRHPVDRKRMAVVQTGKEAVTHYRVEDRYRLHSLIRVKLETGRTHQIRVHMAHLRYPLLGDPVYGGRLRIPPDSSEDFVQCLRRFRRQALHARRLGIPRMSDGEMQWFESPVPEDMQALITMLEQDRDSHAD